MTPNTDKTVNTNNQKKRAYKISLKRAKITGIMCLMLICAVLIFMSPLFCVKSIVVNHGEFLKKETVLSALGFSRGDNIFSINISAATDSVEKLDRVGSCTIERTLPGKVTVTVNDMSESGYIKMKSSYAGIDENGRIIVVTKNKEQKVPEIKGVNIAESIKGDYIKSEDKGGKEKTEYIIKLITALKEQRLIADVKEINIKDMKDISLTLVTDTVVNLGGYGENIDDKTEHKIAFLKAILEKDYPKNGGIIELADINNVTSRVS